MKTKKTAVLITFSQTVRQIVDIPEGKTQLEGDDLSDIDFETAFEVAQKHMFNNGADSCFAGIEIDYAMPYRD